MSNETSEVREIPKITELYETAGRLSRDFVELMIRADHHPLLAEVWPDSSQEQIDFCGLLKSLNREKLPMIVDDRVVVAAIGLDRRRRSFDGEEDTYLLSVAESKKSDQYPVERGVFDVVFNKECVTVVRLDFGMIVLDSNGDAKIKLIDNMNDSFDLNGSEFDTVIAGVERQLAIMEARIKEVNDLISRHEEEAARRATPGEDQQRPGDFDSPERFRGAVSLIVGVLLRDVPNDEK